MQMNRYVHVVIIIFFTQSLLGMSEFQIYTHLSEDQKAEIRFGMREIEESIRNRRAYFASESELWITGIVNGYESPTKMRNGETILTHLIQKPDFGDLHFDQVRMIGSMTTAGARINQPNAHGVTPLTIAIKNGRKLLVPGMLSNGADFPVDVADGNANNIIRAGLSALKTAALNYVPSCYSSIYQRKECEMFMAYLIHNVLPSTITKSQVHAAWRLGYKDISRALALYRKYPEKRGSIMADLTSRISQSLVRDFKNCSKKY
jgi:hypothetical protein